MSITCHFLGHKFDLASDTCTGNWSRKMYGDEVVRDYYRSLVFELECCRCGWRVKRDIEVTEATMTFWQTPPAR